MRLLTHNTLRNNSAAAKGKGFPLRIKAADVRVDDKVEIGESQLTFIRGVLPIVDWPSLVQAANEVGIPTLPATLTEAMVDDADFLRALYHVLMNVHVVRGTLTCPATGREFEVVNEIPNMILEEDECEHVRF